MNFFIEVRTNSNIKNMRSRSRSGSRSIRAKRSARYQIKSGGQRSKPLITLDIWSVPLLVLFWTHLETLHYNKRRVVCSTLEQKHIPHAIIAVYNSLVLIIIYRRYKFITGKQMNISDITVYRDVLFSVYFVKYW